MGVNSMIEIQPPKKFLATQNPIFTIFLAGSIEMGQSHDWQRDFCNHLAPLDPKGNLVILNPRRYDWDSTWTENDPRFIKQVEWELRGLELCNGIFMYLDPKTKSPISLLELGLYAKSKKLVVICPDGFWRKGNVKTVCERYGVKMYNSLEAAVEVITTCFG